MTDQTPQEETEDQPLQPESGSDASTESADPEKPAYAVLLEHWAAMSLPERREAFGHLPRTDAEELFLNLGAHDQAELLTEISLLEKRSWIRLLAPDDAADLIQELPLENRPEVREEALSLLDPQTRREVTALLAYAEDEAGGLMNSRFVRLRPDMTIDEAISYLRVQAKTQIEMIYYLYVLDFDQKLLGVVSFRELFLADRGKKVRDIMHEEVIRIPEEMDQEQVSRLFTEHSFTALPVVDPEGRMKGIVTVDDIVTVVEEEATEDMQKLGGMEAFDEPYFKISFWLMIRKRAGWLMILFLGEMFTATAMGYYEKELARAIVLALFIPLIISSGGNTGSQASTLIIRAMALGEVRLRDWWRVLFREVSAGVTLGLILGTMGVARIMFYPTRDTLYGIHYARIAITVGISLIGTVLWGTVTGSMLPFILRRAGLDPASASAPFVATLVDVSGLIIYFTVASLMLGGVLL